MEHSILKAALLASPLSTTANALVWGTVKPYQDSQCSNALDYTYNGLYITGDDSVVSNQPWTLGMGVAAPDVGNKWQKYTNVNFQNASAPDGNIGNVGYPERSFIVMKLIYSSMFTGIPFQLIGGAKLSS